MRVCDRAFGTLHGVRILELNRNCTAAVREIYFLHDETEIKAGFSHWKVSAFFPLLRGPAEKFGSTRTAARADGVLNIRVGSRLIQFVEECRYNILPRFIKGHDSVFRSICPFFRELCLP